MAEQTGVGPRILHSSGTDHAKLGLDFFKREKYEEAQKEFERALNLGLRTNEVEDLLARARSNAANRYEHAPFSKVLNPAEADLPPALLLRAPADLEPMARPPRLPRRLLSGFNKVLGLVLGWLFGLVGLLLYGRDPQKMWRRWPTYRWFLLKDVGLSAIRHYMNGHTLQDPYNGALVGNQQAGQRRPEWTERYRTASGAWNTDNPLEGAAGARFTWQANRLDQRRDTVEELPHPIDVADRLLRCPDKRDREEVPFLNLLAIAWVQFMVHDWVNHRQTTGREIKIEYPEHDGRSGKYGERYLTLRATEPPVRGNDPFAFENEVTAWWDGSQIYGSDQVTQDRLRAERDSWQRMLDEDHARRQSQQPFDGVRYARQPPPKFCGDGKLFVEQAAGSDAPPLDRHSGVIDSGFTRNMWVGLELFHTLFVKHHNWLCDQYRREHPHWSSDQVFHHARLENSATMAKIHTVEWTPAVLPTKELVYGMNFNWHGMLETFLHRREHRKAVRAVEPTHPLIGGLVGGELNNFAVPHNFSEHFAEVYRLHPGLPDSIHIRPLGTKENGRGDQVTGNGMRAIPIETTRAAGSRTTIQTHGFATLFNSFGHQHMNALVNNNYPRFMSEMTVEGAPVFDLVAADIVRGRERGVPRFNDFRAQLGMPTVKGFDELTDCKETIQALEDLYGDGENGVNRLDVVVGMLCDRKGRPLRGFDNTRFAIFLQSASRRLQTDPFFTDKYNERYYTKAGLDRIDGVTLKELLLRHFEELNDSDLMRVRNAFEPWGTPLEKWREEHPLDELER